MKLEEIFEEWAKDAPINIDALDFASSNIPILHHKYVQVYTIEKMKLTRMDDALDSLRAEKRDFYVNGPTEETEKRGWVFHGRVPKSEIENAFAVDTDIRKSTIRVADQKAKVDALKSIIDNINGRSFHIKNIMEDRRWKSGG